MRVDTLCWYLIKPQIKHQGKDWKSSSEFGEYTSVKRVFQTLFVLLKFLVLLVNAFLLLFMQKSFVKFIMTTY